jgi:hypothetical protein
MSQPVTVKELADELARLKWPVPDDATIKAVIAVDAATMRRAVDQSISGNDAAKTYLKGVFLTAHKSTRERLERRRIAALEMSVLVTIGRTEGSSFALKVKEWDAAGAPDGTPEARYIRLTIAKALEASRRSATAANDTPHDERDDRMHEEAPETADSRQARSGQHAARNHQDHPEPQPQRRSGGVDGDPRDSHRPRLVSDNGGIPYVADDEVVHMPEGAGIPEGVGNQSGEEYLSVHVYGGRAAACFSADVSRSKMSTVRIEAAESSGTRQYNWKGKVAIQLSSRELPLVLATFMHWIPKFEGKGHGANNEKWFALERQGNKMFLSVNSKGSSPRGVPIPAGDGYSITTLLIRQMLKNDPFLTVEALFHLVRKQAELATADHVVRGNDSRAAA